MCGEYKLIGMSKVIFEGSPPHVWRIQFAYIRRWSDDRITSTCVENTDSIKAKNYKKQDHLHMCGEYCTLVMSIDKNEGSPPHVWRIRLTEYKE